MNNYRPYLPHEVPIGKRIRHKDQPESWFGLITTVLPGESPNYNRWIYNTIDGWCSPEDLLKTFEVEIYSDVWMPCGIKKDIDNTIKPANLEKITMPELIESILWDDKDLKP